LPLLRVVGQVAQTYIVADSSDGMVLIDQHAAHERVTYERLMTQRGAQAFDQQGLLIPQTLDLPPAAHMLLLGGVHHRLNLVPVAVVHAVIMTSAGLAVR